MAEEKDEDQLLSQVEEAVRDKVEDVDDGTETAW